MMTITEVGKMFNITPDTLRYYERIGLIDKVQKNSRGIRDYRESDLRRVEFIRCMRSAGLSIEVLIRYIRLFNEGNSTISERKEILKNQRSILEIKMSEMQETLNKLNYKIDNYEKIENNSQILLKKDDNELINL